MHIGSIDVTDVLSWLFVLAGVALLFERVDPEQLHEKIHTNPGMAPYRFRTFRFGVAVAFFILAAVMFLLR